MRRYCYLLWIALSCFSCKSQESKFDLLLKNIKQQNVETNKIDTIRENKVTFFYPNIEDIKFKHIIDLMIKDKNDITFCENEECEIEVRYGINLVTNQLISI